MKCKVAITTLGMILLVPLWGLALPAERELAVTLDDLPVVGEEDLVRAKEVTDSLLRALKGIPMKEVNGRKFPATLLEEPDPPEFILDLYKVAN